MFQLLSRTKKSSRLDISGLEAGTHTVVAEENIQNLIQEVKVMECILFDEIHQILVVAQVMVMVPKVLLISWNLPFTWELTVIGQWLKMNTVTPFWRMRLLLVVSTKKSMLHQLKILSRFSKGSVIFMKIPQCYLARWSFESSGWLFWSNTFHNVAAW